MNNQKKKMLLPLHTPSVHLLSSLLSVSPVEPGKEGPALKGVFTGNSANLAQ